MASPGLPCICLLLVLQEMSSHFENINFKTESRKVILKPSRFAPLQLGGTWDRFLLGFSR